jgi:molybdate transport system substrate-binding protein
MFFNRKKTFSLLIALIFLTSGSAQAFAGTLEAPTTITVFAASSLLKTFTVLGKIFQQTYPGTKVEFSFLASSTLATQLMSGAPADVFASASPIDMEAVVSLVPKPVVFVTNRVVLAVPVQILYEYFESRT